MLLVAGGLQALEQVAIIAAAPLTLVMTGLCVSLFKALQADFGRPRVPTALRPEREPTHPPTGAATRWEAATRTRR